MSFSTDLLSALTEIVNDTKWHKIGYADELNGSKATKLYPDIEDDDDMVIQPDDIALFCERSNDIIGKISLIKNVIGINFRFN